MGSLGSLQPEDLLEIERRFKDESSSCSLDLDDLGKSPKKKSKRSCCINFSAGSQEDIEKGKGKESSGRKRS
jgi:hypothetical protein